MIQPKHFLWRTEGKVGVITLNRPERKNPLTFESYAELRHSRMGTCTRMA
jgi:enoyl-CoA hydratase/carnithine racemase